MPARLFPSGKFRWQMGLRPGDAASFFAPTSSHAEIVSEREHWLRETPGECALLTEDGAPILADACAAARAWGTALAADAVSLHALAEAWEADFVFLSSQEEGFMVEGGAVCFPSHWTLREKLGRTLDFTHSAVPGLNAELAPRISTVLSRLAPGAAWLRENWGLARDAERNHHPLRALPRMDESITPGEVHLRIEHQCLTRLEPTGGILFGIRLTILPWSTVTADPALRDGLRAALESMPDEAAAYKNLATARPTLLRWLSE